MFYTTLWVLLAACLMLVFGGAVAKPSLEAPEIEFVSDAPRRISALGRLEPRDGLRRISAPAGERAVIAELLVDEGDLVERGDLIAVLDTVPVQRAEVALLEAELAEARRERERSRRLHSLDVVSDSQEESALTRVEVARARLERARAELERAHVRSPLRGQVLEVYAREGERVTAEGIVELGRTDEMFAIAEVHESDAGRLAPGQRALIHSPALSGPLRGRVEWVDLKIGLQDVLGNDPAARQDARVVEAEIRLDEGALAASFTHLQVEIRIETGE